MEALREEVGAISDLDASQGTEAHSSTQDTFLGLMVGIGLGMVLWGGAALIWMLL